MATKNGKLLNYIDSEWRESSARDYLPVTNPATMATLGRVPLSPAIEVEQAARAAVDAFDEWRRTPVVERVQYLFQLRNLLEENFEELSRTITEEAGKTIGESKGEMRRSIENLEIACGMPILMQGYNSEDIASGIDESMIRQPVGVAAAICPFNFPAMISFWFMPYAIACGNTYIVKPSEKTPITMNKVFDLIDQTGLPKGVVNLVNGSNQTVDAILDHPEIRAISFVGSSSVAKYVYARSAANGKRVQCQGGAKNPIVVMPDAEMETATTITADSAFGCAGQRCLAASIAITVGDARDSFARSIAAAASSRIVGYGLDEAVEMGPVISIQSKARIEEVIGNSAKDGANIVVDGRGPVIAGYESGNFVSPTVIADLQEGSELAHTELFGPVLGLLHVDTIGEAISLINRGRYGNMACLFTTSGAAARQFRYEVQTGNVGINIGVAAPMAFFPFSGWKESFYGTLHGQGRDAVEFFTQEKVVIERWPAQWSRRF